MASEGKVELGGREYWITPKSLRRSSQMRKMIGEKIQPLMNIARQSTGIEIKDIEAVSALLTELQTVIFTSLDVIFDVVCEYEPAIREDREYLLDNAYDEEIIEAAMVMMRQLFPFGGLVQSLETLSGLAESMTSTNSPSTTEKAPAN